MNGILEVSQRYLSVTRLYYVVFKANKMDCFPTGSFNSQIYIKISSNNSDLYTLRFAIPGAFAAANAFAASAPQAHFQKVTLYNYSCCGTQLPSTSRLSMIGSSALHFQL